MSVELTDNNEVVGVEGNFCIRGEKYAASECTNPMRTVTSTVRCEGGDVVSVKTSAPVPKGRVFDVMHEINSKIAPDTVSIGDIIIADVLGLGVDIIATSCK